MTTTNRTGDDTAIVWFRRDLRIGDHPALTTALASHDAVVALFVADPALMQPAGAPRRAFLTGCVDTLNRSLDGRLLVRHGDPVDVVPALVRELDASFVYVTEDFGPYGRRRDRAVATALDPARFIPVDSPYLVAPGSLFTTTGTPYQVFTPFGRAWRGEPVDDPLPDPPLARLVVPPRGDELAPVTCDARLPTPGEHAAHDVLEAFLTEAIETYGDTRDRPEVDGTSHLSPFLRFGCLHPRQILAECDPLEHPDHAKFTSEIAWRDFLADVLFHRPDAARAPFRDEWSDFVWDTGPDADERFDAWCSGRTGYPLVDAGMRQLLAQGWMPNRVRMTAASFLIKDLHIDWRRGARWFMAHLVDGDLASNQLNWQWVAGSGVDAAPFFRIFNPTRQAERFDPDGAYITRWIPELGNPEKPSLFDNTGAGAETGTETGTGTGTGTDVYPEPIVDHKTERRESLARFDALKGR